MCLDNESESNGNEYFLASCDLTIEPKESKTQLKGYVIKNNTSEEISFREDSEKISLWKKYLCCKPCKKTCNDKLWWLAVRCAKITPKRCHTNPCCIFFDMVSIYIVFYIISRIRRRKINILTSGFY